jgi:hypothetical protein
MEYMKPELNQLGVAESLVLGSSNGSTDPNGHNSGSDAFEFEE